MRRNFGCLSGLCDLDINTIDQYNYGTCFSISLIIGSNPAAFFENHKNNSKNEYTSKIYRFFSDGYDTRIAPKLLYYVKITFRIKRTIILAGGHSI